MLGMKKVVNCSKIFLLWFVLTSSFIVANYDELTSPNFSTDSTNSDSNEYNQHCCCSTANSSCYNIVPAHYDHLDSIVATSNSVEGEHSTSSNVEITKSHVLLMLSCTL